ncbi:MAG: acetyl-CoA synthetase [Pseudonocardiales bacterium]|nr:acetyl-CoA synthetase [Pseudonocardiales bacterium]
MTDGLAALLQRFGAPDACAARLLCGDHPPADVAFTVVEPDLTARDLTFGELDRESAAFASALADLGIGPGDRVGVLMSRSIELVVTLLGIWRRGAVLVPLSTALGRPGIALRLRAASVRLMVVDADRRTKLAAGEGVPADPQWRVVVVRGEPGRRELSFEALMALYVGDPGPSPVAVGGDGLLAHAFTAGTTGPPKAVPVPVRALAAFATARAAHADKPGDLHWDTADPGWPTGLYSALLGPLATGRRGLLTRGALAPAPAWRLLDRYRVTHLHAGPAHFRAMAAAGPPPSGLALRHASSTGEPLPPDLVTWAAEVLGVALHDRYAQAELGTVLADPEPGSDACRPGTLGRPLPGWTVAVLGDDAEPAATGVVGRLAVARSSPLMWFSGYVDDAGGTPFTPDGRWYLTGDTAGVDGEGCLRFSARTGDVIVTAGHRIAPFEVESVLMLHDDVVEAVVVGMPARHGAVPEAYVVLRAGAEPAFGLGEELKRMVRAKLTPQAVPRVVHVVDALPRTPGGSVRRAALRERRANW